MKPTLIKAWPELTGFTPSLPAMTESRRKSSNFLPAIEVNFESVREVTSTGLTIFLLRLLRLINERGSPLIRNECSPHIHSELDRLGAFRILKDIVGFHNELEFETEEPTRPHEKSTKISLPVYRLTFKPNIDRRQVSHAFCLWVAEELKRIGSVYQISYNGLSMLLNEIAKNSADHTSSNALFGLDVIPVGVNHSKLTFALGDLGIGIKAHIESHLPPELLHRQEFMSLYEAYRLALQPGYTSNRKSNLNKGHGMSIITDCAATLGMHLSVFDAESRGLLDNLRNLVEPSHAAIRRIFHKVGNDVGFCYYGELLIKRK